MRDNVIEASWQALADAVNYKLHRAHRAAETVESAASLYGHTWQAV